MYQFQEQLSTGEQRAGRAKGNQKETRSSRESKALNLAFSTLQAYSFMAPLQRWPLTKKTPFVWLHWIQTLILAS